MKQLITTLRTRWRNHMPKFFRRVCWTASLVSGSALAVNAAFNELGATPPEWWSSISSPLIAFSAGIAFAAKFTQTYGKDGQPIQKGLEPTQPDSYNDSDIEPLSADDM